MLSEDDILIIVASAKASCDDAAERLRSCEAVVEAARANVARAEGALQMAQHVLDEHRVAARRAAEAVAGIDMARATAQPGEPAVIEASKLPTTEPPAFIQQ